MTLKELVMQVEFDELLPDLKKEVYNYLNSLYTFREAYDLLRSMTPDSDYKGEVYIDWHGDKDDEAGRWIGVSPFHDVSWEQALSKEIIVADDIKISLEQTAALCLWEITYYGFSPEEELEHFQNLEQCKEAKNKYELALKKLTDSIYKHQIPRKYRVTFRGMQCVDGRYWSEKKCCRNRNQMNRSKRMRKHRQKMRQDYLKRMAARTNLIEKLSVPESSFCYSDVAFLLDVDYGARYDYIARVSGTTGRLAYISESICHYQELDFSKYDNAIVCLFVPSRYPLQESEIKNFNEIICSHFGYSDIRFGSIITNEDKPQVRASVLLNKLHA